MKIIKSVMIKNKKGTRLLSLLVLLIFISCNSDDEFQGRTRIPLFPESSLEIIHGGEQKTWKITNYINKYHNPNYSLEVETSCLNYYTYTFKKDDEIVKIDLGENKCFGRNNDGIFLADKEIFSASVYYNEGSDGNKTIFLEFARGYENNNSTAGGVSLRWYKLAELSEDRMVFHRAGGQFVGEYKEALIFEKIN